MFTHRPFLSFLVNLQVFFLVVWGMLHHIPTFRHAHLPSGFNQGWGLCGLSLKGCLWQPQLDRCSFVFEEGGGSHSIVFKLSLPCQSDQQVLSVSKVHVILREWKRAGKPQLAKQSGVLALQALECMVLLSFNYLCSPLCERWDLRIGLLSEDSISKVSLSVPVILWS